MEEMKQSVHEWFGLTYANYLVFPRLALQELPEDWQKRFVALMDEAERIMGATPDNYVVLRRGKDGRFRNDPWANYRRSTVEEARRLDTERRNKVYQSLSTVGPLL